MLLASICCTLLSLVTLLCTSPASSCSYYHNYHGIPCLVYYEHRFSISVPNASTLREGGGGCLICSPQIFLLLIGFIWRASSNTEPSLESMCFIKIKSLNHIHRRARQDSVKITLQYFQAIQDKQYISRSFQKDFINAITMFFTKYLGNL